MSNLLFYRVVHNINYYADRIILLTSCFGMDQMGPQTVMAK